MIAVSTCGSDNYLKLSQGLNDLGVVALINVSSTAPISVVGSPIVLAASIVTAWPASTGFKVQDLTQLLASSVQGTPLKRTVQRFNFYRTIDTQIVKLKLTPVQLGALGRFLWSRCK